MRLPGSLPALLLLLPGGVAAAAPAPAATAPAATAMAATTVATPAAEYAARRAELMRRIGPDGMLVLPAHTAQHRNGDVDWPFRQEDNLLYLTGLDEPGTALVLVPGEEAHREIVFSADGDPAAELWNGRVPTFDEVSAQSGVAEVVSNTRFRDFLRAAMEGNAWGDTRTYRSFATAGLPQWRQRVRDGKAVVWLLLDERGFGGAAGPGQAMVEELRRSYPELQFRDASPLLVAMRMVKSPSEIATLQRAIDVTVEAQKAAMRRVLSARNEYEVQATIEYTFRNLGACCWGFPSIVASGANATSLHYEDDDAPIAPGSLMLTDIGAEVEGYTADVTRTYPQGGRFSPEQRAVYEAVLRAQRGSMALMKPGARMKDVHEAAIGMLGESLLEIGLVSRNERAQVRMYFPHGLGHQLGLDVHDVDDRDRALEPGMVVTDEPGIYVRVADVRANPAYLALPAEERAGIDAALDRYAGIGVRIEDDVLVTAGAPRNLSAAAPTTVDEIEAWMQGAAP